MVMILWYLDKAKKNSTNSGRQKTSTLRVIDPSFGRAPTWSLASCQGRTGLRGVVRSSSKQCVWYSAIISHAVACCIGHNKHAIIYHIYIVYISNMFLSIFWYDAKKHAYTMATEPWWDGLLQRWFQPYHLKNPIFDGQIKHVPKHQPLVFNGFIDVRFVQTDAVFFFCVICFCSCKNHWLVVSTPLKNMSSSMGRMTSHIYEMESKIYLKPPSRSFSQTIWRSPVFLVDIRGANHREFDVQRVDVHMFYNV